MGVVRLGSVELYYCVRGFSLRLIERKLGLKLTDGCRRKMDVRCSRKVADNLKEDERREQLFSRDAGRWNYAFVISNLLAGLNALASPVRIGMLRRYRKQEKHKE